MIKLPYGLKGDELVHINDTVSGLACGCVCAACGSRLIARKGEVKQNHFAHYKMPECRYAIQTALHYAAKQIIAQEKMLFLPALYKTIDKKTREEIFGDSEQLILSEQKSLLLFDERKIIVDNVYLEKKLNDFVPDVIVEIGDRKISIEIAVTHFVDESKIEKIKSANISTIEIDLSDFHGNELDVTSLKEILIAKSDLKSWIFNAREEEIWNRIKRQLQQQNSLKIEEKQKMESERKQKEDWDKEREKARQEAERKAREGGIKRWDKIQVLQINEREEREEFYKSYYIPVIKKKRVFRPMEFGEHILYADGCPIKQTGRFDNTSLYAEVDKDCVVVSFIKGSVTRRTGYLWFVYGSMSKS